MDQQPDFQRLADGMIGAGEELRKMPNVPVFTQGQDILNAITTMQARMDTVITTMQTRMDTAITTMQTRMDTAITTMQTRMDTRFDGLVVSTNSHEIISLDTNSFKARIDGLETRFDGLETRFDGLETRFDGLQGQFNDLQLQQNAE